MPSTNADPQLREKLTQIEENLGEARGDAAALKRRVAKARNAFAASDVADASSPQFRAAKDAVDRYNAKLGEIEELQAAQVNILKALGEDGGRAGAVAAPVVETWNTDALLTPDIRAQVSRLAQSSIPAGRVPLGEVISREALAASLGGGPNAATVVGTTNMRRGEFAGIVPQVRRPLHVLDLIPTDTMDGKSVPYTVEGGSLDSAAEQVEGQRKAEGALALTDAEAVAQTIAAYVKVLKQTLADSAGLQTAIADRLRYVVLRRLEKQVLAGDGTGSNILGILNTPGIGAVSYDADTLPADLVLAGITSVLAADAVPSAVLVNPADWGTMIVAKALGDGHYYSGGPFNLTPQMIWGVPLIASTAVTAGTVLVGDFALGAKLFIREGVQVLLSDADGEDFTENVWTLLGEMRAALAVFRPVAFCTVDIAA